MLQNSLSQAEGSTWTAQRTWSCFQNRKTSARPRIVFHFSPSHYRNQFNLTLTHNHENKENIHNYLLLKSSQRKSVEEKKKTGRGTEFQSAVPNYTQEGVNKV